MNGVIRKLSLDKGYGWIQGTDGVERFFHRSALNRQTPFEDLQEGDKVVFDHVDGPKGPRAERVNVE